MKKTVLVPTDFSEPSLQLVEHVISHSESRPLDIVLTYCMSLPDSISDLLFFSKIETIRGLRSRDYVNAYRAMLRRHADNEVSIRTDLFTGWNQAAFNNFLAGNQIDEAVIPKHYRLALHRKDSFDPIPFIRKSKLKITEVEILTAATAYPA
ncbi:hypothetical protein [Methylomonas koyamae]|uniref:Uncharacterized protein n=1 Tax=Methylomonas koyamae TaxID=702114 RepID=A0A291IIA6_9GAMM|nr:hypothetical protein [Methylomonas koyamae]ATG89989.1 hypothetical protein MKLM6_1751 [Methylomonas koyamae]OAI25918.1 hypothetical protein A1356_12760 [Methylomonas koyamae]